MSMGSIDPRMMKNMLQLQFTPSLDLQTTGAEKRKDTDAGTAKLFNMLLQQKLNGESTELDQVAWTPPVWSTEIWAQLGPVEATSAASMTTVPGGTPYASIIEQASMKYGVDSNLIQAVIQTESGFNPLVESHAGAKGLMQLMDGTARGLGVANSFDPEQNVDGGTRYLAMLLRKYNGHEQVALAAYNAGPGRVDRLGIQTNEQLQASLGLLPKETQRYIVKVEQAKL